MRRFILTNQPGYDLRDAIENPSFDKSEIVVLDNSGIEIDRIPVTPLTLYMYDDSIGDYGEGVDYNIVEVTDEKLLLKKEDGVLLTYKAK